MYMHYTLYRNVWLQAEPWLPLFLTTWPYQLS